MGTLIYPGDQHIFDDRLLAHLKAVITAKLRRGETFLLNLTNEPEGGTTALWISPGIPLLYRFDDPQPIELSRTWLDALARSAFSARGLTPMPEGEVRDGLRHEFIQSH